MQTLKVRFHKSTIYTNLYGQDYVLVPSSVVRGEWCFKCAFENGSRDCKWSACTEHQLHDEDIDLHYVDMGVLKSGA